MMNMSKTLTKNPSPPPSTTVMFTYISHNLLHHHHSIPFSFKPSSVNLKSKRSPFSTGTHNKQVCFSLPERRPENKKNSYSRSKEDKNEGSETKPNQISDEWGEKSESEPETVSKFPNPDPPGVNADDEWGSKGVNQDGSGNGSPGSGLDATSESGTLEDLKRAFVDTVYGSEFGYRASTEVRAEALELVAQLEAANPTPAPTQRPDLLDGNWFLLYTAFSELLPLLATGSLPLVKVEKITQYINSRTLTIDNSTTISGPIAALSFSASAAFQVQTPSRIEVLFKEGTFQPPEIKSNIQLPQNFDLFGQTINLSSLQQSLEPVQNALAGIARSISGQPPLRVRIPGERNKSWLLITYLDDDLRISRGDGGLFVLVKEGSPLLQQIS